MQRHLFMVVSVPFLFACGDADVAGKEPASGTGGVELARADELFEQQCAVCHGITGAGDGPASFLLFPPARDFTAARFKLASTRNGVPTDADLERVIARGLPGSAMPGFAWIEPEEVRALAAHVRRLAFLGVAAREGDEAASRRTAPGKPLEPIPLYADAPDVLAHGKALFDERCATCHGPDGGGRPDLLLRDADDVRNHARALTAGFLKGGADEQELANRTRIGMHGTAMPMHGLDDEDVAAVVAYLATLLPEDAGDRGVRRRRAILVERSDGPVPLDPGDPRWDEAEWTRVWLAPLWWSEDAVLEADVAGFHDGERVALFVRWPDATADAPAGARPAYADAVALELCADLYPPFFGMGPEAGAADLWLWRAVELDDTEVAAELRAYPHRLREWVTQPWTARPPVLRVGYAPADVRDEAVAVTPAGMRRAAEQAGLATSLVVTPRWIAGTWGVVFVRALEPEDPGEVALEPGRRVAATLAVWNGANRDLRGRKSIGVWHELALAP